MRSLTATMVGLEGTIIEVEVDATRGIPGLSIIGLPARALDEARERITTALSSCGVRIKAKRMVVNLAPAELPKTSASCELAIAVALLKHFGNFEFDFSQTMFFGELSLDGKLKPIRGALPLVLAARAAGMRRVLIPAANQSEVTTISDIVIHPLRHLSEFMDHVYQAEPLPILQHQPYQAISSRGADFSLIKGQATVKRALVIAAAGQHNILMVGPPGAGKTLLAQQAIGLLPPLSEPEALEITAIHSLYGNWPGGLATQRPFRHPHHTTSSVGLLGGGLQLRPGEVSLAHHGVLFLDELPEFNRTTLESLRQPLEEGSITIIRAHGVVTYPAHALVVAAANPCPCGYLGFEVPGRSCSCPPLSAKTYLQRLSGPFLDRIDLYVRVKGLAASELLDSKSGAGSSQNYLSEILRARGAFAARLTKVTNLPSHSYQLPSSALRDLCPLSSAAERILTTAADRFALSARSFYKLWRVAQTIADLSQATTIDTPHIAEALSYRREILTTTD